MILEIEIVTSSWWRIEIEEWIFDSELLVWTKFSNPAFRVFSFSVCSKIKIGFLTSALLWVKKTRQEFALLLKFSIFYFIYSTKYLSFFFLTKLKICFICLKKYQTKQQKIIKTQHKAKQRITSFYGIKIKIIL